MKHNMNNEKAVKSVDKERIRKAVKEILYAIGDNPDREGLLETPDRVADMYEDIFSGLGKDTAEDLKFFSENHGYDEAVLVRDIPFYSMCEHHLLPFFGHVHVAYMPRNGRLLGLSKLAAIVDTLAKKPQMQERLSSEIVKALAEISEGAAVVIEAEHLCMTMRGIKKQGAKTVTSAFRGIFKSDIAARERVLKSIQG